MDYPKLSDAVENSVLYDSVRHFFSVKEMHPLPTTDTDPAGLSVLTIPATENLLQSYMFSESTNNSVCIILTGPGSIKSGSDVNISLTWDSHLSGTSKAVTWRIDGFKITPGGSNTFTYGSAVSASYSISQDQTAISNFQTSTLNSLFGEGGATTVLRISRLPDTPGDTMDSNAALLYGVSVRYLTNSDEF